MGKTSIQCKSYVSKQKKCLRGKAFAFPFWCIRSNRVGKLCRSLAICNHLIAHARTRKKLRTHARTFYVHNSVFCKVEFTKCRYFALFYKKICIYQKKAVPLYREIKKHIY